MACSVEGPVDFYAEELEIFKNDAPVAYQAVMSPQKLPPACLIPARSRTSQAHPCGQSQHIRKLQPLKSFGGSLIALCACTGTLPSTTHEGVRLDRVPASASEKSRGLWSSGFLVCLFFS